MDEVQSLAVYAKQRGVLLLPEFDAPGPHFMKIRFRPKHLFRTSFYSSIIDYLLALASGLSDFSCCNIPKQEKFSKMTTQYTNWP
jgi:hypothetical protein